MKKIAVTGGKGGTGKSTVAVLLSNEYFSQGKKVILVDCDVECPNDFLLLERKLSKSVEDITAFFPVLNKEKCKQCALCVQSCRSNAIFQAPKQYPVFIKDLCSGCGACWLACPHGAIHSQEEKVGDIFIDSLNENYFLITGLAKPGLEETGPVVHKLKKFALDFAEKEKADVVILDTAAGTHCPVINALLNTDLAYAVTEPTPMGSSDLSLILELCKKLNVPCKVIINQSDLGDRKKIEKVVRHYKTKIIKEIPYSKEIARRYSKGKLFNIQMKDVK